MVEATGFEPTTSWSRTKRATKLRYASPRRNSPPSYAFLAEKLFFAAVSPLPEKPCFAIFFGNSILRYVIALFTKKYFVFFREFCFACRRSTLFLPKSSSLWHNLFRINRAHRSAVSFSYYIKPQKTWQAILLALSKFLPKISFR